MSFIVDVIGIFTRRLSHNSSRSESPHLEVLSNVLQFSRKALVSFISPEFLNLGCIICLVFVSYHQIVGRWLIDPSPMTENLDAMGFIDLEEFGTKLSHPLYLVRFYFGFV